ncbi:MAG: hypothetical protein ACO1Q7_15520 [Gemmatimonas sp.]
MGGGAGRVCWANRRSDARWRMKAEPLQHDRMIVANALRFSLSSWSDRLFAPALVVIGLFAIRSALADRPFIFAATAVASIATAAGAGAARLIERRVVFHCQDGVVAAHALAQGARLRYALPIHALVSAILTVCALIGRPAAALLAPVGYLIGAGLGHVVCRQALADTSRRPIVSLRVINRQLQRPIAGACAAALVVLPQLLLPSVEPNAIATTVGILSAVVALLLTMLEYDVIRFMTESGYSSGRIIGIHARPVVIFCCVAVVVSLTISDTLVAIGILGVALAALILLRVRILAYSVHPKRIADTLVSVCGIICFAVITMPMLLPVVAIAIIWKLHRSAASATWLLR